MTSKPAQKVSIPAKAKKARPRRGIRHILAMGISMPSEASINPREKDMDATYRGRGRLKMSMTVTKTSSEYKEMR